MDDAVEVRRVFITDRWGAQYDDATVERFASMLDELDPDDREHCVVSLQDSEDRYFEVQHDRAALGDVETGDEVWSIALAHRDEALAMAAEFIAGDFDALHARGRRA